MKMKNRIAFVAGGVRVLQPTTALAQAGPGTEYICREAGWLDGGITMRGT